MFMKERKGYINANISAIKLFKYLKNKDQNIIDPKYYYFKCGHILFEKRKTFSKF